MRIGLRSGVVALGLLVAGIGWPAMAQSPKAPDSETVPLPGANSFAESQARELIKAKGFTDVSPLTNDSQGIWRGTAKSGNGKVQITVDYKGNVSATPE